jgi:hypothetical protein
MSQQTITVAQGNDPLLDIYLTVAGSTTAYDLTGATMTFYVKTDPTQSDGSATGTYTSGGGEITVVGSASEGHLTVQMSSTHLTNAGTYWYKLDSVKNTKKETVMYGPLIVVDV